MAATTPPILFLAFANDRSRDGAGYLRKLPEEAANLESALKSAEQRELCKVVLRQNVTIRQVLDTFHDQRYRNRVAIFHFGGHANGYQLLMQTDEGEIAAAHAASFAEFLGQQVGLQLVFLNGCSTEQQVEALLAAGIAMVIATAQAIDDRVATSFATHFYTALAGGATIKIAFASAVAAVKTEQGPQPAQLYRHFSPVEGENAQLFTNRWPWALYVREGADFAQALSLPVAAKDPLFGLPSLPPDAYTNLPDCPFFPLHSFQAADAALFFGRAAQIAELYQRVTAPTGEPIILLYGQSGVGKSSLLAAGLLPRLQQTHTVRYARRDQNLGLRETLKTLLPWQAGAADDLAAAWHATEQATAQPLTLILDQIEEYETLPLAPAVDMETGTATAEMTALLTALEAIFVKGRAKPQGKLILGFRKEWLAEIGKALRTHQLPFVEVYLDRLDRDGIAEAVAGVTEIPALQAKYNLTVEDHLPILIADDLLADAGSAVAPTLQFLLSRLWDRAKANSYQTPTFDQALYAQLRGKSLDDFLGDQLALLAEAYQTEYASGLVLDLLYYHITPEVTADQHTHVAIKATYRHQAAIILALVQRSQDLYLLTDPAQNQPDASRTSRLAHDTLAPLLRKRFDSSDAPGQRARRTLANRAAEWQNGATGAPLDEYDLALVERGAAGMRAWTADEDRLIAASRLAQQQRTAAAQRRRTFIAVAATLFITMIIGFSIWVLFEQSRTLAESQDVLRNESALLAARALEQVNVDPVAAIHLSLAALPAPDHPRPYVPAAELALTRALQTSMERGYADTWAATPLTAERVAIAPDYATVMVAADDGLWQLLADLGQPPIRKSTHRPTEVAWDADGVLLSYYTQTAQIWLDLQATPLTSPTTADELDCAVRRPQHQQVVLCTGSTLTLWSYQTGVAVPITGITLTRGLDDVVWAPDGKLLALTYRKAPVQLWRVAEVAASDPLTVGQDIGQLAFVDAERFVTWSFDEQRTQLWSIAGRPLLTYTVAADLVQGFALAPDHRELLLYLNSSDLIRVALATGEPIGNALSGHLRPALAATWHPAGNYLATSAGDGTARIWDLSNNSNIITLRGHTSATTLDRVDVNGVVWQDEHHLLTYGEDGSVRRWQVFADNGLPLCTSDNDHDGNPRCFNFSTAMTVGTGETTAAVWRDPQSIFALRSEVADNNAQRFTFDGATITRTHTITNPPGLFPQLIWSPDGESVLTYELESEAIGDQLKLRKRDGLIRNGATGQVIGRIRGPIAQAFWLPAGTLVDVATGAAHSAILISRESGESILFDAQTLRRAYTIAGHAQKISVAAVYTPTQRLATADRTGVLQVWDLQQGQQQILQGLTLTLTERLPVNELLWNQDGTRLLAAGRKVTLWDTTDSRALWTTNDLQYNISHVAFSSNEALVAIGVSNALFVLGADDGQLLWQRADAHADPIVGLRWLTGAPWPHQLAADWFSQFLARLNGTYAPLHASRLLLLTWSGDGTARLWDWQTRSEVMRFSDVGTMNVALFDPTETYLLTAGHQSTFRVWRSWHTAPLPLLAIAQSRLTHELTLEQQQRFALPLPPAATTEPAAQP